MIKLPKEEDAYLRIDNKKVGEAAVDYLSRAFVEVTNALAHFAKDDTGICVDGKIEVYSGTAMTKESLYGEIPVQIKGTRTKPSGKDSVKYKVDIVDLEKYLKVYDGVLYFVVFMDKNLKLRRIYYRQYLPYDIRETLQRRKSDGQEKLTERFIPLPNDPLQLKRLCMEFVSDRRKQKGLDDTCFLMPGELEDSRIKFEKIELSKTFFSDESPMALKPFETGAYLYGMTSSGKRYVLERISSLEMIQSTSSHTLKAGDFECKVEVNIGEDNGGKFLTAGGISLRFDGTGAIKYTDCGGFRARLRDAKLFRGFVLSGELFFDGSLLGRRASFNDVDLDELNRRIEVYGKYVALMDLLGVVPDWNPSRLSEGDFAQIRRLGEGFVDGRHLPVGDNKESVIVLDSDVAGTRIKVIGRLDGNGLYEVFDLTSPDLVFATCRGKNGRFDTDNLIPPLFSLSSADFRLLANISPTKLERSLEKCPIAAGNADVTNSALLEMLTAYDDDSVCKNELLSCCDIVSMALYNLDSSSEVYTINRAQTLFRMRKLNDEWQDRIRALAASTDSRETRTSSFILMGQRELAASCFNSLGELERKRFMTWPVYNLFNR